MDLEVYVSPRPDGGLQGRVVYSTELFDAGTVERMAAHFVRLLGATTAAPDRPLSEVSLLEPAERHQLLVEWNDTAREVPEATVAELFEAQVGRSPDAVALVFEDQALSYGELDGPTAWPTTYVASASALKWSSGCASSEAPRWWWLCWPS